MLFFCQVMVNVGMVVGVLPVTGVPLPMFSYGGSSLWTNMAALGLVFAVLRESDDDAVLGAAIDEAIQRKPKGHDFIIDRQHNRPAVARHMSVTGG